MIQFQEICPAVKLPGAPGRLYIGAYGFETRSTGWLEFQGDQGTDSGPILEKAYMMKYKNPKGKNRIKESKEALKAIGIKTPIDIIFDVREPYCIEDILSKKSKDFIRKTDEIILDISAMTKLLILVTLFQLIDFKGTLRIVYSEAEEYAPTEADYKRWEQDMRIVAKFPSSGFGTIVRQNCLGSIRMQGQPVTLIAFTSFNEQLVRHMLGTINPHRLLFINGRPPRPDFEWREKAAAEIHRKLIEEYPRENIEVEPGILERTASTLDYRETAEKIAEIVKTYGTYERIMAAATGSKMQTVGLFFAKIIYPEIHIEYPTPDSYFVKGHSKGVRNIHEITIPKFSEYIENLKKCDHCRWD